MGIDPFSLWILTLEFDNPLNQLENTAWRVDSCDDVREHSWSGSVSPGILFLPFFLLSRLSHVLVSGFLPPVQKLPNDAHQSTPHDV